MIQVSLSTDNVPADLSLRRDAFVHFAKIRSPVRLWTNIAKYKNVTLTLIID